MKKFLSCFFSSALLLLCSSANAQYGIITTVAGGSSWGTFAGDGGPATASSVEISSAYGVCKDTAGDLYFFDRGNSRIRKVDHVTGYIETIAGNGTSGYSGDGGPAVIAKIYSNGAGQIACDKAGNVFIVDENNNRIRRVDHTTGIITTIAGNGTGYSGDGGPATNAGMSPTAVFVDGSGNIFIGGDNRIRKVTAGLINTIAGNGTSGLAGDGGLATSAELDDVHDLKCDNTGNIFFTDDINYRVREVNVSGIINTICGSGVRGYSGDGGPATAALIKNAQGIGLDNAGNVYFDDGNHVIRRINLSTGIINTVAGRNSGLFLGGYTTGTPADSVRVNPNFIFSDPDGTLYYSINGYVNKITGPGSAINTLSITDSLATPSCSLPAVVALGVDGTINGIPGSTDSITISVNYGQFSSNSVKTYKIPYWYTYIYGFGSVFSNLGSFTYTIPGVYTPVVSLATLDGFTDASNAPTIIVGNTCDSSVTSISISVIDSFTSLPCTLPMNVRFIVTGTASGTPLPGDSVHIIYQYNSTDTTFEQVVVPYIFSGSEYTFIDTINHLYNSGTFLPKVLAVTSSGSPSTSYSFGSVSVDSCTSGSATIVITDTTSLTTYCSLPLVDQYKITGHLHGYADTCAFATVYVNYGDGSDTTFTTPVHTNGTGTFYIGRIAASTDSAITFSHTYSIAGLFAASATDTAGSFYASASSGNIALGTGCSPLSGIFYIDANLDSAYEPGELLLSYWPYALINTTLGDTTYGWCDDSGQYHLQVIDGDSYTMVADPYGYFGYGYTGDSLSLFHPASGLYLLSAVAGTSYTENFGFKCNPPSEMDMSISGWGWGFVPGDTGIVGIWSSDYLGFICDSLYSTVTLTLDPLLTYEGMWDGPPPTTISGSTLSWVFSTTDNVFDFTADVKVFVDTTAPFGANICNTLYVTPTTISDPNLANNTYAWCEPVSSSWDPNEKQVSPQGFGPQGFISNGTPLSYMIHFQNSGTAPAHNVTVNDTLSSNLDVSTLSIISSSSPVLVYQDPGNVIRFRFNNINLPDSMSNPMGSIGYIAFNIIPKPALAPGTTITNDAGIYFDYNPAVVTNSTLNTISNIGMIQGETEVCVGSSITLSDTTTGGSWTVSNSHATISGSVLTGVTVGTIVVSYSVPGGSVSTTISVVGPPVAGTIAGGDTVCVGRDLILNGSVSGGSWAALNGNATVTGGIVHGLAAGTDTVKYTVSNACGAVSTTKLITVMPSSYCTELVPTETQNQPEIFPNPATNILTIRTPQNAYSSFTLTNNVGQVLQQQPLTAMQTSVNVQSLPPGLYYITLRGSTGIVTQKFVKM